MAPDSVVAERVYESLKADLLRGRFAPGWGLNVHAIAVDLQTSISPVRDALHRLLGERLVWLRPGGGFQIPLMSTEEVSDLYMWHCRLLVEVVLQAKEIPQDQGFAGRLMAISSDDRDAVRSAATETFERLGDCCENLCQRRAMQVANERLQILRSRETALSFPSDELERIWSASITGDRAQAANLITDYHRRRLRHVARLAELLYIPQR